MLEELEGARVIMTILNPGIQDRQLRPKVQTLENEPVVIVAKVVDVDELGIWIEHADYPFTDPVTNKFRRERAYVLVRYENIASIAYFPNLPKAETEEEHRIGFVDLTGE